MLFLIGGTLLAIFVGLVLGSVRRDREQAAAVRAVQDRLSTRYKPEQLFLSPYDRSAVGLSPERGAVVLGTSEIDGEFPVAALVEIEGVRDGTVIRRLRRGDANGPPVPDGGKGGVIRINTLELRITVDHPERPVWIVRFFDWPGGGVSPGNVAFQQGARACERWFAMLAGAMQSPEPAGA